MTAGPEVDVLELDRRSRPRGRYVLVGAVVVAAALVALVVAWPHRGASTRVVVEPAKRVRDAVAVVQGAGNFAMQFSGKEASGSGVTSFDPLGVSAVSNYGTVRFDGHRIWLNTDAGPGVDIAGYASSVYGTLGPRRGALSMLALASPGGYLQIAGPEIQTAIATGIGNVGGVDVRLYDVVLDLSKMLTLPDIGPDQMPTLQHALDVLDGEHLTGVDMTVAIDDAGFIRHTTRVVQFADGEKVTNDVVLSRFGCAGAVVMPGAATTSSTTAPPCADGGR